MAYLELDGVHKAFGEEVALNGISLDCKDGEFLCLLGPSGAGKTTTLNVISGLIAPDAGLVRLDGEDITDQLPQERNMAVAFESYALYPHLSVFDNIAFPLRAPVRSAELSGREIRIHVQEIAKMLAIDELLERLPRQLSGGQRQRVALGRALIRKPQLYLLDEPIAHLDAKLRHRMRGELRAIQLEFAISTIYATPDQLEALSMADRIVVINRGNIEQIGTPDEIYSQPVNVFVARFVGDPPMNIYKARFESGLLRVESGVDFALPLRGALIEGLEAAESVLVGFRPVDVRLKSPDDPESAVTGEVRALDTLGQSTIVTFGFDSIELKAKVDTGESPPRDSIIGIGVDASKLYFFDAETGIRLK
jgi:multiple sugar transport system ATP-binding protein